MNRLLVLTLATLVSSCASTYKHEVVSAPAAKLERGKAILIATPKMACTKGFNTQHLAGKPLPQYLLNLHGSQTGLL